ncbi:MAG: glycoside-pentoside-hexuronide (GPH):cation symporter [Phycisphaerae bacterium]
MATPPNISAPKRDAAAPALSYAAPTPTVSYSTRLSYALPDVAGQLVFYTIGVFLLKFYTDVYGIAAATAGWLMFIPRITDAIDAPVWGILFDKTNSRWGKNRPWFLWLALPFATLGVLTFAAPDLSGSAKILYAGSTLVLVNILYTGINTPVTSILSALTSNPQERVTLTCWRMFGSKAGVFIVGSCTLALVAFFGHGNDRQGFLLTMLLYAIIAVALFIIAFLNLKESAVTKEEQKPLPIKDSLAAAKGNWPWIIICASSLFFWIGFIARIVSVSYFFQYVVATPNFKNLTALAATLDAISLLTVLFLPWFCKITSKRNVWLLGLLGMAAGQLLLYAGLRANTSIPLIFSGWIFGYLASGVAMAMPFSLLSDSVDYGEWKTGIRAPGFLTAIGAAFCLKAGIGLGAALPGWILGATGYIPNAPQSPSALAGINLAIIWIPFACFLLGAIPVLFYKKFEALEPQIHADLHHRRAQLAANTEEAPPIL